MKVITLDGQERSALAVIRSLGEEGIKVAVGSETERSLSSCSRYTSEYFSYASPYTSPGDFLVDLKKVIANNRDAVLFPMTDVTLSEVLKNRVCFGNDLHLPFVDYERFITITDKIQLFRLAEKISVPIPRTIASEDYTSLNGLIAAARELEGPLVLKPRSSRIWTEHGWINAKVDYVIDPGQLEVKLHQEPFRSFPFLIQERIEGPGIGIFLLMKEGETVAQFAHKRIREKPPSGGISVLCESIEPPPKALNAAKRLLSELNWTGIAMVEFKWDRRDDCPKLMEVNARFWGSLQLAVSAGVNFPYLLFKMATGERVYSHQGYKIGLRMRWELGDLDHLLLRLRKRSSELFLPWDAPSKQSVLKEFILDFFRPSVRHEVLRLKDPGPFLFEVCKYMSTAAFPSPRQAHDS